MVPLYLARIEDLGPGDFLKVDCAACLHTALLSAAFLSQLGLSPREKVIDLNERPCQDNRLPRDQWLESGSLQRGVRCEPVSGENSPSYVEKPRFSAGVRPGRAARSGETRRTRQHRA